MFWDIAKLNGPMWSNGGLHGFDYKKKYSTNNKATKQHNNHNNHHNHHNHNNHLHRFAPILKVTSSSNFHSFNPEIEIHILS